MSSQGAFLLLLNAGIATAVENKKSAILLIERAKAENNKNALTASQAAAYRADKAVAAFEQALEFHRKTKRSADLYQTGLGNLDVCERQLTRASDLFLQV